MDSLIRFGFTIEEINILMDSNEDIQSCNDKTIQELIKVLESIGCSEKQIKNIFLCNPFSLTENINSIKKQIKILYQYGIDNIPLLLNSNPFLLNKNINIESIIKDNELRGLSKEEIIDYFFENSII